VNSDTHPLVQKKAHAAMWIVFWPCTAGEVLKWKFIMCPPLTIIKVSAGIPFTVKSLAWRVSGSTPSVRLTEKSVGGVNAVVPQFGLVTEQPAEVGVGVAVAVAVPVAVAVAVAVAVGVCVAVAVAVGVAVAVAVADGVALGGGMVVLGVGDGVGVPAGTKAQPPVG
jgi:hypothetical protein